MQREQPITHAEAFDLALDALGMLLDGAALGDEWPTDIVTRNLGGSRRVAEARGYLRRMAQPDPLFCPADAE